MEDSAAPRQRAAGHARSDQGSGLAALKQHRRSAEAVERPRTLGAVGDARYARRGGLTVAWVLLD